MHLQPVEASGAYVTGFPREGIARVEAAVEQGAVLRVVRIGLVAARVCGRTHLQSMPRCAHGRYPRRVSDAAQSSSALRHGELPPLRATPAGEDAALQGRRRAPLRLARESGGRRVARLGARRRGAAVVPKPAASSASDSAGHAVHRSARCSSWPSRARAAASASPAMATGERR